MVIAEPAPQEGPRSWLLALPITLSKRHNRQKESLPGPELQPVLLDLRGKTVILLLAAVITKNKLTQLPNRQLVGLASIYEQVARAVYEDRGPMVIQPAQWPVLRFLSLAGDRARTVTGIALFLDVKTSTASRAATALQRRGLVSSRQNPADRRSVLYSLTPLGREKLEQDPLYRLAGALGQIGEADLSTFSQVIVQLSDHLTQSKK